ncbi:hypothetical protein RQP46_010971 [Phenoliferia psychrophenolica]
MLPINLLLVLAVSTFSAAAPLPNPKASITLSHTSASTGESSSSTIDPSWFSNKLAAVMGHLTTDLNIHVTSPKSKRSHTFGRARIAPLLKRFVANLPREVAPRDATLAAPATAAPGGIRNSTINATIISKRRAHIIARREATQAAKDAAAAAAATHHNVYIDASAAQGAGGIHDSVINVHINAAKRDPKTVVGEHSVVINPTEIEGSTVHVNILPGRGTKSVGAHSIVIDSSSASTDGESDTTTGDHSAVVSSPIDSSTINLTVVKAKPEAVSPVALAPAVLEPAVEVPVVKKRSVVDWEDRVNAMTFGEAKDELELRPTSALSVAARSHASHGPIGPLRA